MALSKAEKRKQRLLLWRARAKTWKAKQQRRLEEWERPHLSLRSRYALLRLRLLLRRAGVRRTCDDLSGVWHAFRTFAGMSLRPRRHGDYSAIEVHHARGTTVVTLDRYLGRGDGHVVVTIEATTATTPALEGAGKGSVDDSDTSTTDFLTAAETLPAMRAVLSHRGQWTVEVGRDDV